MPTVTTSTIQEIKIEPKLKKKLLGKLSALAGLREQKAAIEHAIRKVTDELGEMRDETGAMSINVDGSTITLVASTYRKFNPKRFVALGGDLSIYNAATEEHPRKPFNKITLKGEANHED